MENREVLNFNTGWLYSPRDYSNAQLILFDDSDFEAVSVPHANKVIEAHKGDDFMTQIGSYRFVSWYRRHFALPEEYSDKRIIVEFEGVATVAEVYVNGSFVGSHKGAYTGFSFDITDYINFGGSDNVISVQVDSNRREDIPPEGGSVDYCLFGGIVRDVTLTVVNPVYVENTFITTPDLSAESGRVNSVTTVRNSSGESRTVSVETVVYDAEGNEVVRSVSEEKTVSAGETAELEAETPEIENPHLWGVDNPYLYTAEVSVIENGETVDSYSTKIGLRWFEFTDTGFYLNGEKIELRGVNRHEQWPWQGRAIPNKLQIQDADLLKYTGFNAVRCSHYPQDPSFLSRCDELGLIVFEEAPGWQHIGDSQWQEVYKTNIEEMIIRDRNHPSIVTWGVRVNESHDNHDFYTSTVALSKELDPTRPTHGVRRNEDYSDSEPIEDIFAANYIYPDVPRESPFISSEHSWEHWSDGYGLPSATDAEAAAFTKSFADVVDYYYGNELCLGGFAWSMFDYNNEVNYTNTGHVFYSGLYDIFRHDKPVSHFYRSQKAPEEEVVLYIANYWTAASPSDVEVYSNCDEVELFVNGVSKGRIKPNLYMNVPHPAFNFSGVTFEAGELEAVGYIDGVEVARTVRRTPGTAAQLSVEADYTTLIADGADMTSVTISLLDENGTRLPYAENSVQITVDGPADFIGENPIKLEGGRAAFLIRTRYHETGTLKCTVSADGVLSGSCEIEILDYNEGNVVPYSEGSGDILPLDAEDINDTEGSFEYIGNWLYISQADNFRGDNHYSNTGGDTLNVTFTGDGALWYGTKAPNHGIMAVSVDGGPETFIDCYSSDRQDHQLLYYTGSLGFGKHTLTVRVTGQKNSNSTDSYINADHVQVIMNGVALGDNEIKKHEWRPDGNSWVMTDGVYRQTNASGDHMTLINGADDISIRATVPIATANDTGFGLLGRVVDNRHYYQLELKYENGGLIWAIWKNNNGSWAQLAFGPYEAAGNTATLRMDLVGETISAYTLIDGAWIPLGSCTDSDYSGGSIGLRTHAAAGSFSDISAYEILESGDENCELSDIVSENGKISRVRLSNVDSGILIAAQYSDDGSLLVLKRCPLSPDGTAELGDFPADGKLKLFVWDSDGEIRPLGRVWEI